MIFVEDYIYSCTIPLIEKKFNGWNGRCIVCGDSAKSHNKKRFWIRPETSGDGYFVLCYNCGYNAKFTTFLKQYFPDVFKNYMKALFKQRRQDGFRDKPAVTTDEKPQAIEVVNDLTLISKLSSTHVSNGYVDDRKIPEVWKRYLFYVDNFKTWINEKIPGRFEHVGKFDRRIVLPFYKKEDRSLFAVAGRALDDNKPRYMTIKFDEVYPKIFGLERANFDKTVYVFEGPIDSLFMPNSIAMAGSISGLPKLLDFAPIENYILVADIEPRNKEVGSFIKKALLMGFKVCILPPAMKRYGKDINDLVKNSPLTRREIFNMINDNVYSGKTGIIKFNSWRKVKLTR